MNNTIQGAICIFHREDRFLVIKNKKTGNFTFVSGAKEGGDKSIRDTAQREIREELGIPPHQYTLMETPVVQRFVFSSRKPERAGKKGEFHVFFVDASKLEIGNTHELQSIHWLTKEDVLNTITFDDLKEAFLQSLRYCGP